MNTPTFANTAANSDTDLRPIREAAEMPSTLAYLPHRPGRHAVGEMLEGRFPGVFRTLNDLRDSLGGSNPEPRPVHAAARALIAEVSAWRARARGRRQLLRMGERELRDLGLSRAGIYTEIHKPFWRG